jgi:putative ATP-dependent endonuclease of OLD family
MVEEPEAHLHPQLTGLLADYLSVKNPAGNAPQTIVSTHSPTLVAAVPTERVVLFFADATSTQIRCNSLMHAGLLPREAAAVRRMMDVTRASMYFAKGLILVEGVCEALLVPVLAQRLGLNLAAEHVAVVPVCGVAFETFKKLLDPAAFGIRTAIVTDGDPPVHGAADAKWSGFAPEEKNGQFVLSARTAKLARGFAGHPTTRVFHSQVTLEYDLAEAGDANAAYVATAWERCFDGKPRTLTHGQVTVEGMTRREKALAVWRGVCLANSTGSKAELSQHLTEMLSGDSSCPEFVVPAYLEAAIRHVIPVRAPDTAYSRADADANT